MAPWKCPECGVWWSGLEHRCTPLGTSTGSGGTEGMNPRGNDLGESPGCNCPQYAAFPITVTSSTVSYKPCPVHPITIYSAAVTGA